MSIFILVILLFISWLPICQTRKQEQIINRNQLLQNTEARTLYLMKMNIGEGIGEFKFRAKKTNRNQKTNGTRFNIFVGVLKDDDYDQFMDVRTCEEREKIYGEKRELSLGGPFVKIEVKQEFQEGYWYAFVYDCATVKEDNVDLIPERITVEGIMLNNGSHFGQNQNLIPEYIFVSVLWVGFVIRYIKPTFKVLKQCEYTGKFFVLFGFYCMFLIYFYRFLCLVVMAEVGVDIWALNIISDILKYLIEGVLVGVMISVAFGWSLLTIKEDRRGILLGLCMAFVNILSCIYESKETIQTHHDYDKRTLPLIFICRGVVLSTFLYGSLLSMNKATGKMRHFLSKFRLWGSLYLIGWPLAVLICETVISEKMHREILVLVEESLHVIGNAMMCHSFSITTSEYRKVEKTSEKQFPE